MHKTDSHGQIKGINLILYDVKLNKLKLNQIKFIQFKLFFRNKEVNVLNHPALINGSTIK